MTTMNSKMPVLAVVPDAPPKYAYINIARMVGDYHVLFSLSINLTDGAVKSGVQFDYFRLADDDDWTSFVNQLVVLRTNLVYVADVFRVMCKPAPFLETLTDDDVHQYIILCDRILIGVWMLEYKLTEGVEALKAKLENVLEARNQPLPKARNRSGYVYLLQSVTGLYKIGRSAAPDNRLRTFNVKLPFEVEFTCLIEAGDMFKLEKQFHDQYASRRAGGEWFALTESDVAEIVALANTKTPEVTHVDTDMGFWQPSLFSDDTETKAG